MNGMKRILPVIFILFPAVVCAAPSLMFETELYDFGTITQGDQLEYTFDFMNMGSDDLSIKRLTAS